MWLGKPPCPIQVARDRDNNARRIRVTRLCRLIDALRTKSATPLGVDRGVNVITDGLDVRRRGHLVLRPVTRWVLPGPGDVGPPLWTCGHRAGAEFDECFMHPDRTTNLQVRMGVRDYPSAIPASGFQDGAIRPRSSFALSFWLFALASHRIVVSAESALSTSIRREEGLKFRRAREFYGRECRPYHNRKSAISLGLRPLRKRC